MVAVRSELSCYVKRIKCTAAFAVVLNLDKTLFKFNKNIIHITAYVPLVGSRHSSIDLFNCISNIILDYDTDDYFHMLVGDLIEDSDGKYIAYLDLRKALILYHTNIS